MNEVGQLWHFIRLLAGQMTSALFSPLGVEIWNLPVAFWNIVDNIKIFFKIRFVFLYFVMTAGEVYKKTKAAARKKQRNQSCWQNIKALLGANLYECNCL